jgi:hypothetical protein
MDRNLDYNIGLRMTSGDLLEQGLRDLVVAGLFKIEYLTT